MTDQKLQRRALVAVFFTVFLDLLGFGMFIPVLVNIAKDFSADEAMAASINTWYSVGTLLAVVFLGRLSDRFGRKPLLMVSIFVSACAHLATGFAPGLLALIAIRFVAGAAAGNISVAQACIADLTQASQRARSMVIIGLAFGGGFAFGPALGAFVSRLAGDSFLPAIGIVACALNLINLLVVSRFLQESHPRFSKGDVKRMQESWRREAEDSSPEASRSQAKLGAATASTLAATRRGGQNVFRDFLALSSIPALQVTFLMQFLQTFGFVGLETVLPFVLKDAYGYSTSQIYDAFVVLGVSVLFINGAISRRVLARIDERWAVKLGQLFLCLGIAGIHMWVPSQFGLLSSLVLVAAGTAFTNPAVSSLTSRLCPPEHLGLSFGALQVVGSLARIAGPVSMGALYKVMGGSQSLWVTVALIAIASLVSFRIPKPQQAKNQTE